MVARRMIETFDLERATHPVLSISHRIATGRRGESASDVIARADRRMYDVKRAAQQLG